MAHDKHYPKPYLDFVRAVIVGQPDREREMHDREEMIAALLRPSGSTAVGGSGSIPDSEPERILEAKERDPECRKLDKQIRAVAYALRMLNQQEHTLVELLYWGEMPRWSAAEALSVDLTKLWRIERRMLGKVAPAILELWG
jgi:DNA-directed RNA polymerase specialized sigma subunit